MTRCCQCENQALVSVESQCDLCQGLIMPEKTEASRYPDLHELVEEWLAWEAEEPAYAA